MYNDGVQGGCICGCTRRITCCDGYWAAAGLTRGAIDNGHGWYALGIQGGCICGGTRRITCRGGYCASAGFTGGIIGWGHGLLAQEYMEAASVVEANVSRAVGDRLLS